jgi:hypothetical protein
MSSSVRAFGGLTLTYDKRDLAAVSLLSAVVAVWASVAAGAFSLRALAACEAAFFVFYLVGSLFAAWQALARGILFDLPLRLLVGYAVVNTTLLVLAWVSPLGLVANFCAVAALAACLYFALGKRQEAPTESAGRWVVVICVVATTLWCQDSIHPMSARGSMVLVKPWVDGFYHAVHVRLFALSHGAGSLEDFRLAGVPARPYHYGMYLLPAFIKQAAAMPAYAAFAGVLAPVGVLFTGLAAYAFFGSLWGAWPGVAACVALMLLPDGAQQGMGNPFMSYHFLTQISPSATYGLALLAVAWLFVVRACAEAAPAAPPDGSTTESTVRDGQAGSRTPLLQLGAGWVVAGVLVAYKLHYVVASALLLLLVPALFFERRLGARKRAAWALCACLFYVVSLCFGQKVPGVPLIRFDGSSAGEILRLVRSFAKPSALRDFIELHTGPTAGWTSNLLVGIPYVLLAALGVFLPLLFVFALRLRRRTRRLELLFPWLLIVNFLAMFFGLALDFDSSTPDELSHRPIMIVYFFVVSWLGAAVARTFMQSRLPSVRARAALLGLAGALMLVPAVFGPGVQLMWAMPRLSPVRLPASLLAVADYIRGHGGSEDVFQDSQFDRTYALAALSERRTFVAHTLTRNAFRHEMVDARTAAIERFMGLRQPKLIVATARALGFRWFVLERGDSVQWPPQIAEHPVFESGPFKLYEF